MIEMFIKLETSELQTWNVCKRCGTSKRSRRIVHRRATAAKHMKYYSLNHLIYAANNYRRKNHLPNPPIASSEIEGAENAENAKAGGSWSNQPNLATWPIVNIVDCDIGRPRAQDLTTRASYLGMRDPVSVTLAKSV